MAAANRDTAAARVAVNLFKADLAEKHPEAAAAIGDDLVEASIKLGATVKNQTPPPDPRFPAQNVSGYCWAKFNTYIMCMNHFKGAEQARCLTHKRHYKALCPDEWIDNFTGYISENRWHGVAPKDDSLFE